jgi:hypothetical protein
MTPDGRVKKREGRETTPRYLKTIREGKWIVGTEMVFDYGKMNDVPFDFKTREPVLPIHVYKIKGKSVVENMVPMLDQVQMTYLRLQNAIAKAAPSGLKIDIGKMQGLTMGSKKWSPLDLIRLYTQTGHMLYNSSMVKGELTSGVMSSDPGKAIEELKGGIGNAVQDAISSFEMAFQLMSELTGIDRVSAVSSQDPRTSAAETRIAAAGTSDTLYSIFSAWLKMYEDASKCACLACSL